MEETNLNLMKYILNQKASKNDSNKQPVFMYPGKTGVGRTHIFSQNNVKIIDDKNIIARHEYEGNNNNNASEKVITGVMTDEANGLFFIDVPGFFDTEDPLNENLKMK